MSEGRTRCSGSSMFLKKKFGAGYVLSLSLSATDCDYYLFKAKDNLPVEDRNRAIDLGYNNNHNNYENSKDNGDLSYRGGENSSGHRVDDYHDNDVDYNGHSDVTPTGGSAPAPAPPSHPRPLSINSRIDDTSPHLFILDERVVVREVEALVRSVVPEAEITSHTAGEVVFALPINVS